MTLALIGISSFVVALIATPLAMVTARHLGIMDRPGALKTQTEPVPYLGGAAVFVAVAVGVLSGRPIVLVPLAVALALGVADDRFDLAPRSRLAGQVVIGAVVVVTAPERFPGVAAVALTVAAAILLVNGMNLLDGLDLLAGGVAAVAAVGFALVLEAPGRQTAVALGAGLAGFLLFNRPPARIYLGDGGSYLLGTSLCVLLAEAWGPTTAASVGTAALALVAIPVAEVAFAVVRRLRGRRSLTAGDRGHPYDRLVARGWPRLSASLVYIGAQVLLTAGAVVAVHNAGIGAAVAVDAGGAALLMASAAATGALSPDQEAPA